MLFCVRYSGGLSDEQLARQLVESVKADAPVDHVILNIGYVIVVHYS